MRLQDWLSSLEFGTGRRVLVGVAAVLAVLALSLYLALKRHHGPSSERVMDLALLGRSLARGEGFTTQVRYPQAVSVLSEQEDWNFDFRSNLPDLHNEPLYPLLLAAAPFLAGEELREQIFFSDPVPSASGITRYRGDDYLLLVNVVLLWATLLLVWLLSRRLFNPTVAWMALAAVLLSAGVWEGVLLLSGVLLPSLLLLSLVVALSGADAALSTKNHIAWVWIAATGMVTGLLFLADYAAVLPALAIGITFLLLRLPRPASLGALAVVLSVAVLVCLPWLVRNYQLTGHPLGLAWQSVALSIDDPTAEPAQVLNQLSSESPRPLFRKVMGKGLSGIRDLLSRELWAGGSFLFFGLFLLSPLYSFRRSGARLLHWSVLAGLAVGVLLYPFLSSGGAVRPLHYWFAPLIIPFGAALLFVLIEVLAERPRWQQQGILGVVLLLHSLPLLHMLAEPRRAPFSYPPYVPGIFLLTRTELMDKRPDFYGIMADVPAGLAWYSDQRVWSQPISFEDFERIHALQPIEAHLLTPATLNRPFFGDLTRRDGPDGSGSWVELYASLPTRTLPASYPLRRVSPLIHNIYLLHN